MRPGPGLVVMALAFISGARRGSTSSISSKTTTTTTTTATTTSSPPQEQQQLFLATSVKSSYLELFQTTLKSSTTSSSASILTSASSSTGSDNIFTTTSLPPEQHKTTLENFDFSNSKTFTERPDGNRQLSRRPKDTEPFNIFNTFLKHDSYYSYPSTATFLTYTYPLPSYVQDQSDDSRARAKPLSVLQSAKQTRRANINFRRRRKRRTHSAAVNYRESATDIDDATENLNDSDDTPTLLTTAIDSSSDRSILARGLPVHFSPLTAADSSKSLDEDDIFALVAEDDLLSEESFDHLVKLTDDKIGDTNEEDYSSGTESTAESSSGNVALENADDTTDQQNTIEDFVPKHEQQPPAEPSIQHQQHNKNSPHILPDNDDNNDDETADNSDGDKSQPNETHNSEQDIVDTVYNAHLVSNPNEEVVLLNEAKTIDVISSSETAEKESSQLKAAAATSLANTTKAELEISNKYQSILESSFALTRLNPWISACDLAAPGPVPAPDLQGQCSAGTLPVAWVDEGPGPPTCLYSCEEETPFTNKLNKDNMINSLNNSHKNNNKKQHKNKNDNKLNKLVGYTTTTNTLNIKLRNSQPTISHNVNTNEISSSGSSSNSNSDNNNQKHMDNNSNINTFKSIIQKILSPFNNYQIINNSNNNNNNNNDNKMPKIKRNFKETSSANSQDVESAAKVATTNVTQSDETKDSESANMPLHTIDNYDDMLHDMLMPQEEAAKSQELKHDDHQFNDAAIAAAGVAMQLNQQQPQQNHNNNNIVKMKLTTATANDRDRDSSSRNFQSKQFELKYNHLKHDHLASSSNNNNNNHIHRNNIKTLQSNNINNFPQRSDVSLANPTTTTRQDDNVAVNNRNSDQFLKKPPPEKQQQQCLEYLGDRDKTMPTHLCHYLTPSDRLAQLRQLRLRNCCERNVYNALHTLALNATLSGGVGCVRVLEDLIALDDQASRITCGLTDILFRFDCRQVYSIIHQCSDCKEAYRRWVCSTLVPYFAETSDIMRPPEILITSMQSASTLSTSSDEDNISSSQSYKNHHHPLNNNTNMASNLTTSHSTATTLRNNINSSSSSSSNINNETDISSVMALKSVTSNFITNSNNNEYDRQYDANNYQQQYHVQHQHHQQPEQHHVQKRNVQKKQHANHKLTNNSNNSTTSSSNNNNKINDFSYETILIHHKNQTQQQLQHASSSSNSSHTPALTIHDIINHKSWLTTPKNILSSSLNHPSINEMDEPTFGRNSHHKSTNKRHKRSDNSTITATATKADDAFASKPSISLSSSSSSSSTTSSLSSALRQMQRPRNEEQLEQQQSLNFISTANNEDSFNVKNPVITKLLKRSKRKEFEFRKRRRIRPCLSVCQTVEQKCPYLLPADRAPSMPTQYAGEPTFLCLDYNIAETAEQLKKASHGTNDCCYTYCSNSPDGICTYCDDMWEQTEIDKAAEVLSQASEIKVFNITMKTKGQDDTAASIRVESKIQQIIGEEKNGLKMSTVAIAVRNGTALENATRLAERLQYYAYCDGVFYYDVDADDMPEIPLSENCQPLDPVHSRCTIPYYASNYISSAEMLGSYRKHNEAHKLFLLWLSTLVCLWSCYSARLLARLKRFNETKTHQAPSAQSQHQQPKFNNTAWRRGHICCSCQTRDIMPRREKCVEKIMSLWYDYRESKVLIIFSLEFHREKQQSLVDKKTLKVQRHLRQIQRWSWSVPMNLKILKIPTLILLIGYKEILLLLFKKRQKLRKRKVPRTPIHDTMPLYALNWFILAKIVTSREGSSKEYETQKLPKICGLGKNKIPDEDDYYYINYYYYYYYCSCSPIFSCSCNKLIIIKYNYYYNNNENYIKMFKYNNFKTCNFNNIIIHNNNNNNNNKNSKKKKNNNNKMRIKKIYYNKVSIIKMNTITTTQTTTTKLTTHILIFKYNKTKNNNKFNSYNIITFIIIIYNIYNKKSIFNSLSLKPNCSHHNLFIYYYENYSDCNNYSNNYYYFEIKFKSNHKIITNNDDNIIVLLNTFALTKTSTITSTSTITITITITFYYLLKTLMICQIISIIFTMITVITLMMMMMMIMILQLMLIMFIMPLFFKSFIIMKYKNNNNNHHMNNIITSKLKISSSPNSSHNSKKTNYRYRYFYYYNFNIHDWWQRRRWWHRRQHHQQQQAVEKPKPYFAYFRQPFLLLLLNDRTCPESCFTYILL